jgi:glycosyltransferase involved in cell wall biosynthesis
MHCWQSEFLLNNLQSLPSMNKSISRRYGVILPHTLVFGGVKRFLDLGNLFIERNIEFIIFTPAGEGPTWFDFKGKVETFDKVLNYSFDALFITEQEYLPLLRKSNSSVKIFYAVIERDFVRKISREKDITIFANSTNLFNYLKQGTGIEPFRALGGIDLSKFVFKTRPEKSAGEPFCVLVYGRFYRKKKGTHLVVKACERLYKKGFNIKLLLFDSPVDERSRKLVENFKCKVPFEFFVDYPVKNLPDLYNKADVFVSAERNAGWSNTSAEAMACGVPVIATKSGTQDFLFDNETGVVVWRHSWFIQRAILKLYRDEKLRNGLAVQARTKIKDFSWQNLADNIHNFINARLNAKGS